MVEGLRKRNVISEKPAQNDNKVKHEESCDLAEEMMAEGRVGEFIGIIGTILLVGALIIGWIKLSEFMN